MRIHPVSVAFPDLVYWEFYLFCSLQNHLNDKKFDYFQEIKNIQIFFEEKPRSFYKEGNQNLWKVGWY